MNRLIWNETEWKDLMNDDGSKAWINQIHLNTADGKESKFVLAACEWDYAVAYIGSTVNITCLKSTVVNDHILEINGLTEETIHMHLNDWLGVDKVDDFIQDNLAATHQKRMDQIEEQDQQSAKADQEMKELIKRDLKDKLLDEIAKFKAEMLSDLNNLGVNSDSSAGIEPSLSRSLIYTWTSSNYYLNHMVEVALHHINVWRSINDKNLLLGLVDAVDSMSMEDFGVNDSLLAILDKALERVVVTTTE